MLWRGYSSAAAGMQAKKRAKAGRTDAPGGSAPGAGARNIGSSDSDDEVERPGIAALD